MFIIQEEKKREQESGYRAGGLDGYGQAGQNSQNKIIKQSFSGKFLDQVNEIKNGQKDEKQMTAFQHSGAGVSDQSVFKNIKGRKKKGSMRVLGNKIKNIKKDDGRKPSEQSREKSNTDKRIAGGKIFDVIRLGEFMQFAFGDIIVWVNQIFAKRDK